MVQKILIFKILFFIFFIKYNLLYADTITGKAIIVDGDTISINKNKIRLHGIDAPEIKQTCKVKNVAWNCGIESEKALKNSRKDEMKTLKADFLSRRDLLFKKHPPKKRNKPLMDLNKNLYLE